MLIKDDFDYTGFIIEDRRMIRDGKFYLYKILEYNVKTKICNFIEIRSEKNWFLVELTCHINIFEEDRVVKKRSGTVCDKC